MDILYQIQNSIACTKTNWMTRSLYNQSCWIRIIKQWHLLKKPLLCPIRPECLNGRRCHQVVCRVGPMISWRYTDLLVSSIDSVDITMPWVPLLYDIAKDDGESYIRQTMLCIHEQPIFLSHILSPPMRFMSCIAVQHVKSWFCINATPRHTVPIWL